MNEASEKKPSAADEAVSCVLDRVQTDPDFRWHMLGTEMFAKLCRAEAERKGVSADEIEQIREVDKQPSHRRRSAQLPKLRLALERLSQLDLGDSDDREKAKKIIKQASRK